MVFFLPESDFPQLYRKSDALSACCRKFELPGSDGAVIAAPKSPADAYEISLSYRYVVSLLCLCHN